MKKVLFVVSYSHLGGAETRAVDLAISLRNQCIPIFLIYGKPKGSVQELLDRNNIEYFQRFPFNWKSRYNGLDLILRLVVEIIYFIKKYLKYNPVSMISFCADANIIVSCANIIIQNKRAYWCQEDDFIQWRWKRLFLWRIKNSKNIIAVSDFIKDQILVKTKTVENRIITINNAINTSTLNVKKVESNIIRLSIVGHVNKIKNQGFVIKNIQTMLNREFVGNFELNLYGLISDKEYWNLINSDAAWLKYHGYQSKNYIYNNSDIIIIASTTEASPLVLFESDYFNLSLLCSKIPAFANLKDKNISFFNLDDDTDFITKLEDLLQNKKNFKLAVDKEEIYLQNYENYLDSYRKLLVD